MDFEHSPRTRDLLARIRPFVRERVLPVEERLFRELANGPREPDWTRWAPFPEIEPLKEQARAEGLENITFCGPQPKDRMVDFVNACDVGAAVLQDNPTFRTVYPNKVFDYMVCSRPTLLAIDGAARDLVCVQARAGIFTPPENPRPWRMQ